MIGRQIAKKICIIAFNYHLKNGTQHSGVSFANMTQFDGFN